ncbi:MAG: sensor histidine kinase [Myxococcota bacterium]
MVGKRTDRYGFPGGLRAQLLLLLLVLLTATFGLIAVLMLQVIKRTIHSAEIELTAAQAETLAAKLAADEHERMTIVDDYLSRDDIAYAGWYADDQLQGSVGYDEEVESMLASTPPGNGPIRVQLEGRPYVLSTTSMADNRERAVLLRSLAPATRRVEQTRDLLFIYLGVDALFILIVGYALLTFFIVRPIRAIGVATERAAKGDLASPISVLPPNEFGQVGRSFNEMLGELRSKREELEERLEELNRANEELSQAQESLIRSEKLASVGQLSAGVAHEIGNPLAAIAGYVEILDDDDLDEDVRDDILERTGREVDRIRSTIRDLLDFSREDRDHEIQSVRLRDCVDEARSLVEAQPRSREVELDIELPDADLRVLAIESQLVQVLVNLLINAVDIVSEGGRVELTTAPRDERVVISVCDDGPGIADEDLQRLFEPFYTTKDPGEGTGLGLAISLRIIKRFGGDIDVESTPGEGSCFRVSLEQA